MKNQKLTKEREQKLQKNIWKFYLYRLCSSMIFIIPIFVLFLQENGLSMTQIMILQSVYTGIVMLTIVPAGIFADFIGRKTAIVLNSIVYTVAWLMYASGYNFWNFFIAEIIMALSASLWSASGTAFFYDNLKELNRESDFKHVYGNLMTVNHIVWGIAAFIGGYMATFSLRLPFFLTAIPVALSIIVSLSLTETKNYKHAETNYLDHLKDAARFTWGHVKVKSFIIYTAIMGLVFSGAFMLYQPHLKEIQVPLLYFGAIFMVMDFTAAFAAKMAYRIEAWLGERRILISLSALAILAFIGMSFNIIYFGIAFIFMISIVGGISHPVITDYMNKHISSHHRATVLSLKDLARSFISTIFVPFIGVIVDLWSLSHAFICLAILVLIAVSILFYLFHINHSK